MNYLLLAAAYFFPFFHVVLSEAAIIQNQTISKDMPIRVYRIFDKGQLLGHIVNLFTPLLMFYIRNSYEPSSLHQ